MSLEQEIDDNIDIKILGVPHAFLRQQHICAERDYLFLSGFSSLYDAIHGWMTGWIDGWKKLHEKQPRHPLLYVIDTYMHNTKAQH
jgi:hypothetical protein